MDSKIWLACFLGCILFSSSIIAKETTIYLVRHAEKVVDKSTDDPELTEAGRERAAKLVRVLRSIPIDVCVASQFKRTQQTIQGVAESNQLELIVHPAGQEAKLLDRLRKEWKGQQVLIAAHSNTIPDLCKGLGVELSVEIGELDYDNLFVIVVDEDGRSRMLHLHYGD